jgi:phosphoglucomutase
LPAGGAVGGVEYVVVGAEHKKMDDGRWTIYDVYIIIFMYNNCMILPTILVSV